MRDVLFVPFNDNETIVVASDNSGAIGLKEADVVKVPYEMVGYFSFRVAVMECIAAGGKPFAVTLQNFCGDGAWSKLKSGIEKGLAELGIENINITGSTESNFQLNQSAIGLTVLGKKKPRVENEWLIFTENTKVAVIGSPLVGNEVVKQEAKVAPLSLFKQISSIEKVITLPVGSKGVLEELNTLFSNRAFEATNLVTDLNFHKSSGPATCFLVAYPPENQSLITSLAGQHFHEVLDRTEA